MSFFFCFPSICSLVLFFVSFHRIGVKRLVQYTTYIFPFHLITLSHAISRLLLFLLLLGAFSYLAYIDFSFPPLFKDGSERFKFQKLMIMMTVFFFSFAHRVSPFTFNDVAIIPVITHARYELRFHILFLISRAASRRREQPQIRAAGIKHETKMQRSMKDNL